MIDKGFYIKNKNIKEIDINLSVVRIAHTFISSDEPCGEFANVSDCIYFTVNGKCRITLSGKNFNVERGVAFFAAKNEKVRFRQMGSETFECFSITFDSFDCHNIFSFMKFPKTQPLVRFDESVETLIAQLYETVQIGTVASVYACISHLYAILSHLAEGHLSPKPDDIENDDIENEYIEKAIAFMRAKYYDDINVNTIADALNINRSYFSVLFRKTVGVSPLRYLTELRIAQACKLLAMGKTVVDTSILAGYNSPSNFGYNFKRIMNMSPIEYKKEHCKQTDGCDDK